MFSPKVVFAQNLLQNPWFEGGDSGWNKYGSTQLKIVDNALNGTKAGALTSDKTGAKYIYQDFETFEGEEFQLSGLTFWNDSSVANAKLRVEWYDSSSTRVGLDEVYLVSKSDEWQYLTMSIKAPPLSKTARVEAYTSINQASPINPVLFDDLVFEKVNQSEPAPTLIPTSFLGSSPTPTPTPTLTPTVTLKPTTPTSASTATYKINDVKDEDGEILSSVKVYVDEVYIHHYAPEVLTFCDGCQCDGYVACGLGQHTIKLEKTGYEDWSKEITINPNTSDEVSPVMIFSKPDPTSTPTVLIKPTSTPTQKISPTPTPKKSNQTATDSGEILGADSEATPAFYPLLATQDGEIASLSANNFKKSNFWPKLIFVLTLIFLFFVSLWVWYTFKYAS